MNAQHRAGRNLEKATAKAFGTQPVRSKPFESAPDLPPLRLPSGELVQVEVKYRANVPRVFRLAIEQARSYCPDGIPIAVVGEPKGEVLAALPLLDLVRLLGLQPHDVGQLALGPTRSPA